jgi:hypothetical protein
MRRYLVEDASDIYQAITDTKVFYNYRSSIKDALFLRLRYVWLIFELACIGALELVSAISGLNGRGISGWIQWNT